MNSHIGVISIVSVCAHVGLCAHIWPCVCIWGQGARKKFPQKMVAMDAVWGLDQILDHSRAIWVVNHRGY